VPKGPNPLLTLQKTTKLTAFIFFLVSSFTVNASYSIKTGKFTLYSAFSDSIITQQLSDFVQECDLRYRDFFNYELNTEIEIYLAASDEQYKKYTTSLVPEWSSGVAFITRRVIILKPGSYYDPAQYRETLFHEVAHFFIADIVNIQSFPVWLNEGTALFLSGKSISWTESITIGNALATGTILDLNEIDSLLTFTTKKAEISYLQSFLAVQYVVHRYGKKPLVEIIKARPNSETIDQVFFEHTGIDFIEFEIDWYNDVKKRYQWFTALQFENLFWLMLVLIIISAYILKKIRNRKIYREWEEEEIV
jgi:hypothetical protein